MTTNRFDPDPNAIYGTCLTCGEEQPTEEDSRHHMSETHEESRKNGGNRGHTISITNPGRPGRVHSETSRIVESAMEDAMSDLQRLVDDGHATGAEIRESMWMYSDFKDAWDEWVEDGAS